MSTIDRYYNRIYKKIGKIIYYRFPWLRNRMPDKMYLQCYWRERLPQSGELNVENPQTFNEKLNWLKLYYHNPLLHRLVDKYEVKKYVENKIGGGIIVPTLGVWNSVEKIDWESLPNQFVLKCTHDSGSVIVCTDKDEFDVEQAKKELKKRQAITDYYYRNREWAYKGVKPRIIAEEYIDSLGKADSIEYKMTCINGKVRMITVCSGIAHVEYDKRHNDHFDQEGTRLSFYANYTPAGKELPSKEIVNSLVDICEKLTKNLPECRVDLYVHKGKIFFGEMTFYTWGGFINYTPREWDYKMGEWFDLPMKY